MNKIILLTLLLASAAFARFSATPIMECEAFNNLKHSQNSNHATVNEGQSYEIIEKHKGQYLTLVRTARPMERWIDAKCFEGDNNLISSKVNGIKMVTPIKKRVSKIAKTESLLALSWQNAFCQTHQYKKECKFKNLGEKGYLTLHGLWPQPRNNVYCNLPRKVTAKDKHHQWRDLPEINLSQETLALMKQYMPGYKSGLHKHEWYKHGTCYGTEENEYFSNALKITKNIDNSSIGDMLRASEGKRITLSQVRAEFDKLYGIGSGKKVQFKCKNGLLTEIWINLKGRGDDISMLIKNGKNTKSRCTNAIIDRAGY